MRGFFYTYQANPPEIDDPYYAEARIDFNVEHRDLTMVLVGKMVDVTDCEKRGQKFWRNMLEDCDTCEFIDYQCKPELSRRYQIMFENRPTFAAYVAADRGSRFERNARIIVWGLTRNESIEFCNYIINAMVKKYSGQVNCVEGLAG